MNIGNITNIKSLIINRKKLYTHTCNAVFFMLLSETSPEIFPEHKESFFIPGSFAFNSYIFEALTSKKLLLPL